MSEPIEASIAQDLIERARDNGVAVASVSDGHIFIFSRSMVEALIYKMDSANRDEAVVFVKNAVAGNKPVVSA